MRKLTSNSLGSIYTTHIRKQVTTHTRGFQELPPSDTMTTYHNPWSESTHKPAANFSDWFGPNPRGESEITTPYSGYPRETLALPDAYKGSNLYLTNIMLNLIQEEDLVPTRILLPMRVTQNETSVTWDEFRESSHPVQTRFFFSPVGHAQNCPTDHRRPDFSRGPKILEPKKKKR